MFADYSEYYRRWSICFWRYYDYFIYSNLYFSPVEHKNKKLNSKEKAIYKLIAVVLSGLLLLSSLLFTFASNFTVVGIAMEMGIVLDVFLMVLEKAYQMCRTR